MNTGIIIALVYLAIHIFSLVAKEMAKKKQREKQMAEEQNRRIAEGRLEVPAPEESRVPDPFFTPAPQRRTASGPLATQPVSVRTGTPIDDLAARRKAQLEKLRTGRAANTGAQSTTAPPQTPGRDGSPSRQTADRSFEQVRQEQQRRERAEVKLRAARQAQAGRERDAVARANRQQHTALTVSEGPSPARAVASASRASAAMGVSAGRRVHAFRQRLMERQSLRDMFVFKELLDQPLSMR